MGISKTKAEIVKKSTDLFYKHGFVKASIRDIVKAVGINNSTIYNHFKSKDEILYDILEDIGSVLLKELRVGIEAHDDPIECLREMVFRQVCLMKEKKKEIKIYMEEQYQLPTVFRERILKQHRHIYDVYYKIIYQIKELGVFRNIDQTVMTFAIFAMMNWSYRWFQDNGRLPIEKVAEDITQIFFGGVFKESFLEKNRDIPNKRQSKIVSMS